MRRGRWILATVLLLALAFGVGRTLLDRAAGPGDARPAATLDEAPDPAAKPRPARAPATPKSTTPDDATYPPGRPVDLDTVDRDRDLCGVVVRRDGTPVAGAEVVVVVHPWRKADFITVDGYDVSVDGARTKSAADGTFAFRLRRGTRTSLRVTADGFPPVHLTDRLAGERIRVVVENGARLRVTAVDEENRLLPGLRLRVWRTGWRAGSSVSMEAVTDADGDAVFDGLPTQSTFTLELLTSGPGNPSWVDVSTGDAPETAFRYVLPKGRTLRGRVVDDATGEPVANARVGMNWVLDLAVLTGADGRYELPGWTGKGIEDIHVLADGYARASAIVGAGTEFDFRLRRGFEATGRIVDGAGRPVGGALVGFVGSVRVERRQEISNGNARCGDDGRFRVTGLDPKMPHVLIVVADGFGRLRTESPSPTGALSVDLGDVVMPPAHLVSGRVVDAAGKPMQHVPVVIEGPRETGRTVLEENSYGREEECRTDDLGRFAFADLAAGTYEMRAAFEGSPPVTADVVLPVDRDVTDVTISAGAAETVEVRVVDDQGAPVAGQWIMAQADDGADVSTESDAKGVGRLKIPWDRAEVHVFNVGGTRALIGAEPQQWKAGTASLTFVLHEGSAISGEVLDPDGKGVPRAALHFLYDDELRDWSFADEAGKFENVVPKGRKVRIVFDGVVQGPASDLVGAVECGAPAKDVVLRCERVAADRKLTVKVTSPDGEVQPGASVQVRSSSGREERTATTDAQGIASFDGLPARPRTLFAAAAGTWAESVETTAMPEGQQVVVTLRRALEIRGIVVDADGRPARAEVRAVKGDESFGGFTSDGDGRFVVRVPADFPGPFRVVADDPKGGRLDGVVDDVVPGGGDVRIVLPK